MAVLEMKKVRIIVHKEETPDFLGILQKFGWMEFIDISQSYKEEGLGKGPKTDFEFDYVSNRLDFAVNFLSKFQHKNFLKKVLEDHREEVEQEKVEEIVKSFDFNEVVNKSADLEAKISDSKQRIQKLKEEERIFSEWIRLDIPTGHDLETQKTETIFISPKQKIDDFEAGLKEKELVFNLFSVTDKNFVLTFFKEDKDLISKLLNQFSIDSVDLPTAENTPEKEIERIQKEKIDEENKILEAEKEAKNISDKNLANIKVLSDYFLWKKQKDDVLVSAIGSSKVSVFEGWIPLKKLPTLESSLSKDLSLFTIEKLDLKEGEEPPVEIENNRFLKPFESVTRLYGLPGHRDIDPTLFLSGFFFIFFGLSLTDVFYGIFVLAIFSAILFFFKVPKEMRPLFGLLALGGLASALVGFFFGGFAGIDVNLLPGFLKKIQIFDPISSPLPIFYLSLAMGVLQVFVGIALKILFEAKNKNLIGGILDNGPWLLLFISLILFFAGKFDFITNSKIFFWLIMFSLASLVLTQGRKEKSVPKKAFMGVMSLYSSIGYFSDILSYSRLLALGLATSALAFSINLIAVLARDMVPYVGLILMVFILIIGHLFNIVINVLGAFIHSARLQFVEFFSKFLTGTGKNFKPFRQEERNVVIVK